MGRDVERKAFEAIKKEYAAISATLDDIRDVVRNRLTAKGAFLEMKTSLHADLKAKLANFESSKHGISHTYGVFFRLMTSIMAKAEANKVHADQKVVDTLLGIIDRFEENLSATLSLERQA